MSILRLASELTFDSIVDGEGLRCVLWLQGCHHACIGCHNPATHSLDGGFLKDSEELFQEFIQNPLQDGLTISGGEPFLQAKQLLPLAKQVQQAKKTIWIYTGYTIEQLTDPSHPTYEDNLCLLAYCNVLIDGRYIQEQRNTLLPFRGSANQRIIDITQSIWLNTWMTWTPKHK